MPAYLETLVSARAKVAALIDKLVSGQNPNYSLDGESVEAASYLETLTRQLESLDKAIQRASGPVRVIRRGRA